MFIQVGRLAEGYNISNVRVEADQYTINNNLGIPVHLNKLP